MEHGKMELLQLGAELPHHLQLHGPLHALLQGKVVHIQAQQLIPNESARIHTFQYLPLNFRHPRYF
jgi:hypothetical protein